MKTFIFSIITLFFLASPVLAQTNYDKALEAYAKKDYKTAIQYLKEYVAEEPSAEAYYLLGYSAYKLKNMAESAEYFKEAYLLDPSFEPKHIKFDAKAKKTEKKEEQIKEEQTKEEQPQGQQEQK
ncbi:MAG: tetratricopeptide repeat protein [Nitrospiraceae bacterium]|nr:tetratricopeptide repeat protein [Nitrospiraceae bacterium]